MRRRTTVTSSSPRTTALAIFLILVTSTPWHVVLVRSSIPRSSSGSITSIPPPTSSSSSSSSSSSRTSQSSGDDDGDGRGNERGRGVRPSCRAWNASPKINHQGYLTDLYRRVPGEWETPSSSSSHGGSCRGGPLFRGGDVNSLDEPVIIRQVPGDGCCLFHAVTVSLNLIHGRHLRMDDDGSLWDLKVMSRGLRRTAVRCLRSCTVGDVDRGNNIDDNRKDDHNDNDDCNNVIPPSWSNGWIWKRGGYKRLFIQGNEYMSTSQLLHTASAQYGITPEEYCNLMEQDSYWGGGPEIVALCNVLRRPIHVYELVAAAAGGGGGGRSAMADGGDEDDDDDDYRGKFWGGMSRWGGGGDGRKRFDKVPDRLINEKFLLRRMATFGSPKYDSSVPVHILSADSRFPDVSPDMMKENGNHFMAIFPVNALRGYANITGVVVGGGGHDGSGGRKPRVMRGGASSTTSTTTTGNNNKIDGRIIRCGVVSSSGGPCESWPSRGEWYNDFDYGAPPPLDGGNDGDWIFRDGISSSPGGWFRRLFRKHD